MVLNRKQRKTHYQGVAYVAEGNFCRGPRTLLVVGFLCIKNMENKIQEALKNNKVVVVIVLIAFLFLYFWNIRPSQIRKQCSTHEFYIVNGKGKFSGDIRGVSDEKYKLCLIQNGLSN